jgi:spermidine/putrescine transport system ATP-binding protein
VNVEIAFQSVILKDDENEGLLRGSVKYILYKGDHYHLTIYTDNNLHIYVDTHDIWDEGDRVGVSFAPKSVHIVAF